VQIISKPGIYLLRNKINNKVYIGKAVNIRKRLSSHKNSHHYARMQGLPIVRSIRKHGWENFEISILECFDKIDNNKLLEIEADYIKKYDATNPKIGYNLVAFGMGTTGYKHTEETKRKLSEMKKGEKNFLFGKHLKEETKQKLREKTTERHRTIWSGENNPRFGIKHTLEARKKMSDATKGKNNKPVKQIDLKTGEVIKIWHSAIEAAKFLNPKMTSGSPITQICKKRTWVLPTGYIFTCKSAFGFYWEYA
jgi:group I intron endonuclease